MFANIKKVLISPILLNIQKLNKLNHHAINSTNKISDEVLKKMHNIIFSNSLQPLKNKKFKKIYNSFNLLENQNIMQSKDRISYYFIKNKKEILIDLSQISNLSELIESLNYCYVNHRDNYKSIARDILRNIESKWIGVSPTKEDILRLIFLILAYQPKNPSLLLMNHIEEYVNKNITQFNFSDLSIISLGFFATNTRYSNYKTVSNIASQFEYSIKLTAQSSCLSLLNDISNMLKSMTHVQYCNVDFYESVGNVICNILQKYSGGHLSPPYLSRLCSIIYNYSSLRIYHANLLKISVDFFEVSDQPIRLKDYGRLLWSLSTLRYTVPLKLLEKIVGYLDTDLDKGIVKLYTGAFIECLMGFCLHDYPHKRGMSAIFTPELFNIYKTSSFEKKHQWSFLYSYGSAEGHVAENEINIGNLDFEFKTRRGLLSLLDCMCIHFDSDLSKFKCGFILPFSNLLDIELRVNADGKIISFNDVKNIVFDNNLKIYRNLKVNNKDVKIKARNRPLSNIESLLQESNLNQKINYEKIYLKPKDCLNDIRKISIKILGENQYLMNDPRLHGYHFAQLKMLQDQHYEVYVIDPNLAREFENSSNNLKILQSIFDELLIR